jgi:hypothetical protein
LSLLLKAIKLFTVYNLNFWICYKAQQLTFSKVHACCPDTNIKMERTFSKPHAGFKAA